MSVLQATAACDIFGRDCPTVAVLPLNMSVLQQPVQPLDVFVLHQPKISRLWTCLSNTSPAYDVSVLKASCAAQTCPSCLVLPLDVRVLQQLCCLWGLDMSVLQQPVISLDVSVLQHPLLPFDTSVFQLFTVCTTAAVGQTPLGKGQNSPGTP
jgi:hypothetical protein